MQVMIKKPSQFFIDNCSIFDQPDLTVMPVSGPGFEDLDVLFNSVTHLDSTQGKLNKLFKALFMYKCLENTGYFKFQDGSNLKAHFKDTRADSRVFFACLMFHYMLAISSNCHSVSTSTSGYFKRHKYGIAVFSRVVSVINHSCNPNTGIVVVKNIQVTIATRRIEKGQEICHVYQGHFADTPLPKRRQLMQNFFHFTCQCLACTEDYPVYEDLPATFDNSNYALLCTQVQNAIDLKDYKQAMFFLMKKLSLISDALEEPHQLFVKDRAAFLECLWQCYSNKTYLISSSIN